MRQVKGTGKVLNPLKEMVIVFPGSNKSEDGAPPVLLFVSMVVPGPGAEALVNHY